MYRSVILIDTCINLIIMCYNMFNIVSKVEFIMYRSINMIYILRCIISFLLASLFRYNVPSLIYLVCLLVIPLLPYPRVNSMAGQSVCVCVCLCVRYSVCVCVCVWCEKLCACHCAVYSILILLLHRCVLSLVVRHCHVIYVCACVSVYWHRLFSVHVTAFVYVTVSLSHCHCVYVSVSVSLCVSVTVSAYIL